MSAAYYCSSNNFRSRSTNNRGNNVSDKVITVFKQQSVTLLITAAWA